MLILGFPQREPPEAGQKRSNRVVFLIVVVKPSNVLETTNVKSAVSDWTAAISFVRQKTRGESLKVT